MKIVRATTFLAMMFAWSACAVAAPILLRADPAAPDHKLVAGLYESFLKANPQAVLETAVVDLDGRGVGSIITRFRDKTTCAGDVCHITILQFANNRWREVFGRSSAAIETIPSPTGATKDIRLDGGEVWRWSSARYLPDLSSIGTIVEPTTVATAPVVAASFGKVEGRGLFQADLEVGAKVVLVVGRGIPYCGPSLCQSQIVMQDRGAWRRVGTPYTAAGVAVLASRTKGLADLAFPSVQGYTVWRWDGHAYVASQTSFVSVLTPAP